MIKIDAHKKLVQFKGFAKEGLSADAAGSMKAIFKDLIRRDDEELECNDLLDLAAIAVYSEVRGQKLLELIEQEKEELPKKKRKNIEFDIALMRRGITLLLEVEVEGKKMKEIEVTKLEGHRNLLIGLLHYHERMTLPIKTVNQNPSIDIGIDVYGEALRAAIDLFTEKIGK